MSRFSSASRFEHASPERVGVLLLQLGTPDAPEPAAVRRYLREFLCDPRVVEIPKLVWRPILEGIILPTRGRSSARKYASIWTDQGSPLAVNTARQAIQLRGHLGERGIDLEVGWAMRYGAPSVAQALREMRERRVSRLLVLPLYPQYSASTSASALDAVWAEFARWRNLPELRTVRAFHDHPSYLDALAGQVRRAWTHDGPPDRLVMSFHGMPRRTLDLGDPYHCECLATGRLLAQRLGLAPQQALVTFQSRFGKAEWLQPYTDRTLAQLGAQGVGRVDVICPGFVADCLETLEEIAIEGRDTFLAAGGRDYRYIPCLNDAPEFAAALADLVQAHTCGWPMRRLGAAEAAARDEMLARRRERAVAGGAKS